MTPLDLFLTFVGALFYVAIGALMCSWPNPPGWDWSAGWSSEKAHARWTLACIVWPVGLPIALVGLLVKYVPLGVLGLLDLLRKAFPRRERTVATDTLGKLTYTGKLTADQVDLLRKAFGTEPDVEPEQPTPGEWSQPPRRLR